MSCEYSPRAQSKKNTILGRNLWMFVVSLIVFPGKPFQPSQMFLSKARANSSETPPMCSTLGEAPVNKYLNILHFFPLG